MKATFPPLPVTDEVFETMVRMHEQRFTYEQIGVAVALSAQEVEALRWKHLDRWLNVRETVGRAVRSDLVMEVMARIQIVMSVTSNPKDIALLTKAMEGILKHDTIKHPRPATPKPETPTEPEPSAPEPLTNTSPTPTTPKPDPVALTPTEMAGLRVLRDESPTNTELLYKMQQVPTLYAKCMQLGSLPMIENPAPPPAPKRSWMSKLFTSIACVLMAATVFINSTSWRVHRDEPAPQHVRSHPPNH